MRIELTLQNGKSYTVSRLGELCFTQTAGVACDSLWAYFYTDEPLDDIVSVRAFKNNRLIFNGICDCQKLSENENGYKSYFYARSSAALLIDNEAEPLCYNKPSANQLCFNIASRWGFEAGLPNIYSDTSYEITKGTSCYGAISKYVLLNSGKSIYITPDNVIKALELSQDIVTLDSHRVLDFTHTTNRSEPYFEIAFKKTSSSPSYNAHTRSRLGEELGLNRTMLINLSSLPQWQRENTVLQRLKESYEDYKVMSLKLCGYVDKPLLQRFSYKTYHDYWLKEKKYYISEKGEFTSLTLKKRLDIKEITYVD